MTPLELNPGDGGFKTTGFCGFSLLKYAKINLICWEFYSTNLGILNGGTEILRKKSHVFLKFKAPMYTTLGITASQVFF